MKIKLLMAYDGSPFGGWQKQKRGKPTLQGKLEEALSIVFNQSINTMGSGRTDTGVHAMGQVVHFEVEKFPENLNLVRALNSLTPPEMVIKAAWEAPHDFHAVASAIKKNYRYLILNSELPSAFRHKYSTWVKHALDLQKLNQLTSPLLGEHDFKSFQTTGTEVSSTIRRIYDLQWRAKAGELVEFSITGSGFLKQMVRNIVGTALDLHRKGLNSKHMSEILASRNRTQALGTAPAQGLYLYKVEYPLPLDNKCRKL
ncbi:MAG: tRNA pseudouridine(38-40) synthase TruA [Bdellovibrionaceae bacterium]|nr:tRNA pseudouridine(38-40) synthase TruA [Pseudobdellovibrionaceae bacterium]